MERSDREMERIESGLARPSRPSPAATTDVAGEGEGEGSSEGMIPQDVWAEILGLAPDQAAQMAHAAWEVCSTGADVTERAKEAIFQMLDALP